jgi:iron complex transport system substrate-binding protein/vitamin B12 transport system substrate-binding protein
LLPPATRFQERRASVLRDPVTGVWRARLDTARAGTGAAPVVDAVGVNAWQAAGLPAARLGRVFMIDADAVFRSGPRLIEMAEPICALIEQSRK